MAGEGFRPQLGADLGGQPLQAARQALPSFGLRAALVLPCSGLLLGRCRYACAPPGGVCDLLRPAETARSSH